MKNRYLTEKETFYECVILILQVNRNDKSIDSLNDTHKYKEKNINTISNFIELFEKLKICFFRKY